MQTNHALCTIYSSSKQIFPTQCTTTTINCYWSAVMTSQYNILVYSLDHFNEKQFLFKNAYMHNYYIVNVEKFEGLNFRVSR